MHGYLNLSVIVVACGLAAGCTSRQLQATGQAYQRNQCQQLPDQVERERCLGRTDATFDDYRRERDAGRK